MRLRTKYTQRLPTECDLVLDIPCFEGCGSIAHDFSGKNNHGTINSSTWSQQINGVCLNYDGDNSYFICESDNSLNLKDEITFISTIYCLHSEGSSPDRNAIYAAIEGSVIGFWFFIGGNMLRIQEEAAPWGSVNSPAASIQNNIFYNVAFTKTVSGDDAIQVIIDGAVVNTGNLTVEGGIPPEFGKFSANDYFDGSMNLFKLYKRVLSTKELNRVYEQPDHSYCRGS